MKRLLLTMLFIPLALLRAAEIVDVSDLANIKVKTDDLGIHNAGDVKGLPKNHPALAASLPVALAAKLDAEDETAAQVRLLKLRSAGIALPQAVLDRQSARLAAKLASEDTLDAQARITKLAARGIALPKAVTDAHAARIEALRAQRETALKTVMLTDPLRALQKMTELIAAGIPIGKDTQAAVQAAQPPPAAVPVVPVVPVVPPDGL